VLKPYPLYLFLGSAVYFYRSLKDNNAFQEKKTLKDMTNKQVPAPNTLLGRYTRGNRSEKIKPISIAIMISQ
jgi:hypothetical protein